MNPSNAADQDVRKTLLWIIGACVLVGIFTIIIASRKPPQAPNAEIVALRTQIETCRDQNLCVGGFVKFKDGRVKRLIAGGNCVSMHCAQDVLGIVELWTDINTPAIQEQFVGIKIALPPQPQDDPTLWRTMAVEYAKQFLIKNAPPAQKSSDKKGLS